MQRKSLSETFRWFTHAVFALCVVMGMSVVGVAQTETGQISGTVNDPNGAAVAGASVTAKNVGTGGERTVTTDSDGTYTITNLQPGTYDVTATGTGFQPGTQRTVVQVGGKTSLDVPLGITAVGGEITVVAGEGGVEVNTQTQELADVVTGTQIRELPTLTRNPYALVATAGNASFDSSGASDRGAGYAINGQRSASTNLLLDGADNNDVFTATVGQNVPLDAVGEFRVITSNFSAEYGRASGGIINVATRSGTNEFHGTAFEFNRVSRFASNGFYNNANSIPKPVFTRNQFGYSLGGPIVKNKAFFFSSTEWIRVRSGATVENVVPTPQLIAASAPATRNFFAAYGALSATPTGEVFTAAQTAQLFNVQSGAFRDLANANPNLPAFMTVSYAVPTNAGGGNPQNSYQTINRADWNISNDTQIYGRYAIEKNDIFEGSNASSPYTGYNTGITNFNQNALVSLTHSFTPSFVSQTKLAFNRFNNLQPLGANEPGPTLYLTAAAVGTFGNLLAFPGYLPFNPGSAIPFGGPQNLGQVFQDFNYTAGTHSFRFGGQYVYIQDNRIFGAYQNSVQTLGSNNSNGLNNLVLGQLNTFAGAIFPQGKFPGETVTLPVAQPDFGRSNRYNEFALYVNDSWRIRPSVTLNLGLRYEYYGTQHNKNQELDSNFYFPGGGLYEQLSSGNAAQVAANIRAGSVQRAPNSPGGKLWAVDKNNFAPRVGFAWDVTGDGRTSLRGGYGMAFERNFGNVTFNVIQNPPNYAVTALQAGVDVPQSELPIFVSNNGPFAGSGVNKTLTPVSLRAVDPNIKNAFAHFYSLAFERELVRGTVASIEYSGSAGRDLYSISNINRPGFGQVYLGDTQTALRRLNLQYTDINFRGNGGKSNYNGLTFSLESSNLREYGMQFTARYTWSSAKDNLSSSFSESTKQLQLGFLDPFDPQLDYGPADFDVRHRFSGSMNWEIPFAKNTSGVARQILHGWSLTGVLEVQSGSPFSIYDCTNAGRPGQYCARLVPSGPIDELDASREDPDIPDRQILIDLTNQIPGNGFGPVSYLPPFPAGMTGRNAFRGPAFWNADLGVLKNFHITETKRIQLRAEFFNVFNHANDYLSGFENEVNTSGFGTQRYVAGLRGFAPNAVLPERRNVQLAVKFIF